MLKKYKIMLIPALALAMAIAAVGPAAAQDADVRKALDMQKSLQALIKKVRPAYVFFGRGGSAFCISPDGYILTNYHVARRAERTGDKWKDFVFADGKKYSGKIVWYDPAGDVALCKLDLAEGETVPYVKMGDSDKLAIGDHALAIGNPFSLGMENWDPSISLGIVSAVRRYKGWYSEAVQTDAAVNPGNSGGPLFNMKGEVVGINGMIEIDQKVGKLNVGVGYAVPITQIKRFIEFYKGKFEKGGRVYHGAVKGLEVDPVPAGRQGAIVKSVPEGSSAEKAGFKKGDVITTIECRPIIHPQHVQGVLHTYPAGYTVTVTIEREGYIEDLKVKLDKGRSRMGWTMPRPSRDKAFFGVGAQATENGKGIKIMQVVSGSGADKAGLKVGDVIMKLNNRPINSTNAFTSYLSRFRPGHKVKVHFTREGEEKTTWVTLTKRTP